MKSNDKIALKIAELRQEKALTQSQLATMLGVSRQAVSKWESGQALPDIAVMLELTKIYGITIEDLIDDEEPSAQTAEKNETDRAPQETGTMEEMNMKMNITELLQMAPYMSKEAVGEIATQIEEKIQAWQLAKLAPFVKQEVLEALIEKHHPEMNWDTLRRLAPFMSRESVDNLAREIAEGKRSIHPTQDEIDKTLKDIGKTIDDIGREVGKTFDGIGKDVGKAFDDFGKGVSETVQKVIRFGSDVFSDVGDAINGVAADMKKATEEKTRSERATAIRRRAFERALEDGRFDWIGEHIAEIDADTELKSRIATEARKREMYDWICTYMGACVDEETIRNAIANGNWDFLGDNAWEFEPEMQELTARAAVECGNWEWLDKYMDQLDLTAAAYDMIRAALTADKTEIAHRLCEAYPDAEKVTELLNELLEKEAYDGISELIGAADAETVEKILLAMADKQLWADVEKCIASASDELKETLMEKAVEAGDFDAVDMLDRHL